jgi:hypothetical protein
LAVLPFTPLILISQSMNINVFRSSNGKDMSVPVSFWHFATIVWAVLYVLHVLFATPRLPSAASDLAVSVGNLKSANSSAVQPPWLPYFVLPLTGTGRNSGMLPVTGYSTISYSVQLVEPLLSNMLFYNLYTALLFFLL